MRVIKYFLSVIVLFTFSQVLYAQTSNWIFCADEGGTCTVPANAYVRYGANSRYATIGDVTGTIACTNARFGDPAHGDVKHCEYQLSGWVFCANEGESCSVPAKANVRYGANKTYSLIEDVDTTIACNNAEFGDPIHGVVKQCEYRLSDWVFCAHEGASCSVPANASVRYGAQGQYETITDISGSVACNNAQFGDPIHGVVKQCEYRLSGWEFCAQEGATCSVSATAPTTATVRYGFNGSYAAKRDVTSDISCSNAEFGDPIHGVIKACEYRESQWVFCANEGATCFLPGTATVRYGADDHFAVANNVETMIACTNMEFGDPIHGTVKRCEYRLNHAPVVSDVVENQRILEGDTLNLVLPVFTNADHEPITVTATRADGSALPSWLMFDAGANTLSGTPLIGDVETLSVQVTGQDTTGDSASIEFSIVAVAKPTSWIFCADEGGTCQVPANAYVRYGANGNYATLNDINGSIACNNARFGDPAHGEIKQCEYQLSGWVHCANEGQACVVPANAHVRYGANKTYALIEDVSTEIACNNAQFGDPIHGFVKQCEYRLSGWEFCADEGGTCSVPANASVRYGADGHYATQTDISHSVACNNAEFGDPIHGVVKQCEYRLSGWEFCAEEGATCSVPTLSTVRYGRDGSYATIENVSSDLSCSNAEFGDPIHGVVKQCEYKPSNWVFCAAEGTTCFVPAQATVRYGADGNYHTVNDVEAMVRCDNAQFGDPAFGVIKQCEYRLQ